MMKANSKDHRVLGEKKRSEGGERLWSRGKYEQTPTAWVKSPFRVFSPFRIHLKSSGEKTAKSEGTVKIAEMELFFVSEWGSQRGK